MTNSSKTPTGKTSKGKVSVYIEKDRIKARLPRQYFGGEQPRIALGMEANEANMARAQRLAERMTLDLQDGCFDETLAKYGITSDLKLKSAVTSDDQSPPKPELSLMEVWDMYCEYKKQGLRESHYKHTFQGQYKNYLQSAIEATKSEDSLKIRNWLVENRSLNHVKKILSCLSKAYKIAAKNKLLIHNPFEGMSEEIISKGAQGKAQNEVETETDDDVLDRTKAYTWNEAQTILEYVQKKCPHWYNFLKFKFLTGCRTGEVPGLYWCDVDWGKERILIRRTYDKITKKFYPLKNDKTYKGELIRKFPMPKDGELWNLLKSIPQGEPNEIVFKSKTGKVINSDTFGNYWRGANFPSRKCKGIIPTLIEQGKLTKYIKPYNTRHTFITHAVFDLGIDDKIVSNWCGHQIEVSNKHYQDVAIFAGRINPEVHQQQSEIDQLKEQLKQQQLQMEEMRKLLESKEK
ncbi:MULTISPECIES: site-specific integrase [unclassified Nostoc]|uniref:site-specific integrase n=1 Tax=unclassified Nostoc TaxID=2593658 RepID=UPI002AD430F1|nr:site-specific integrase [Nostoc sp. DedQUE03]MDZ8048059.1 site-specific integrase [Nostoc sp. DedQUE02]